MGRKVNPIGFRLGIIKDWESKWFAEGAQYAKLLAEDTAIRKEIRSSLGRAGVSRIDIQRFPKQINVTIVTAKPGIVIGRRGANINALKARLEHMSDIQGKSLRVDVTEVPNAEVDARVVAEGIAEQLERRVAHKRVMRQVVQRTMRSGAQGIKVQCSGRLSGAEMARREWVREGRVPLHTLRADIDYASEEAATGTGRIGIKVWIYRGDVRPESVRTTTSEGA
ncbi:MAG: 30S ribosomal protein S3 [Chloroflexi bacterium]|nr:30S ribosomal protein S3 [Chloroflexota bacterium]